jgi:hypothetical protein
MACTELDPACFRLLVNLEGHPRVAVGNKAVIPMLEQLHAARMVNFDQSERPVMLGNALGYGWASLLPDGTSALADWRELGGSQ